MNTIARRRCGPRTAHHTVAPGPIGPLGAPAETRSVPTGPSVTRHGGPTDPPVREHGNSPR